MRPATSVSPNQVRHSVSPRWSMVTRNARSVSGLTPGGVAQDSAGKAGGMAMERPSSAADTWAAPSSRRAPAWRVSRPDGSLPRPHPAATRPRLASTGSLAASSRIRPAKARRLGVPSFRATSPRQARTGFFTSRRLLSTMRHAVSNARQQRQDGLLACTARHQPGRGWAGSGAARPGWPRTPTPTRSRPPPAPRSRRCTPRRPRASKPLS
jgi:hypothetical protein